MAKNKKSNHELLMNELQKEYDKLVSTGYFFLPEITNNFVKGIRSTQISALISFLEKKGVLLPDGVEPKEEK